MGRRDQPTHYYDPTAIPVEWSYDLTGAAVLLVATATLVLTARYRFQRVGRRRMSGFTEREWIRETLIERLAAGLTAPEG